MKNLVFFLIALASCIFVPAQTTSQVVAFVGVNVIPMDRLSPIARLLPSRATQHSG